MAKKMHEQNKHLSFLIQIIDPSPKNIVQKS